MDKSNWLSLGAAASVALVLGSITALRFARRREEEACVEAMLQGSDDEEAGDGANAASPLTSAHVLTPHRRNAHSVRRAPDSAYPTGEAVVATSDVTDPPRDARRKLSLQYDHAPIIVGVAGASGSGKTSLASLVVDRLRGIRAVSISSDSYYKTLTPEQRRLAENGEMNFDHPSAIDFELLATHLSMLKQGQDVEIPVYDFSTHSRLKTTQHISGRTDVIFCDGIFVLHVQAVREQCDLTIFCQEDLDICLARRLKRDISDRGRTVESVLAQYVKFVRTGYLAYVAPSMSLADFIIPRARENRTAIALLARDLGRRVSGTDVDTLTSP